MGYYRIINGIKWYYRLKQQPEGDKIKKGLFTDVPRHALTGSLIVGLSYHDANSNKEFRLYTNFKSYLEFGIYQLKLQENERCFYEIILGESSQKPHFDIDIDNMTILGEDIKDNLIDSVVKVLSERGVDLKINKDILIYTSHGKNKQSYHVVINNYCHTNNVEAKAFYDNVMDYIKPEFSQWIDSAVYSPTQQFRIVGSQKLGSTRKKIFQEKWTYKGKIIEYEYPEAADSMEHKMIMQLEASIVGFTGNCRFLPPFEPRIDKIKSYTESEDIDIKDAKEALNLVAAAGNISVNDSRFPYKFLGINGPIVMLKRTKSSCCKICNRVHEHENPYLLVVGDEKSVYFHCRRAPENKKLYLGKLTPNPDSPIKKVEKEEPSPEQVKHNEIRINWTKNILDRVQKVAQQETGKEKKFISSTTEINPEHKKQLIQMFVDSK
jgi:hypothetical protein